MLPCKHLLTDNKHPPVHIRTHSSRFNQKPCIPSMPSNKPSPPNLPRHLPRCSSTCRTGGAPTISYQQRALVLAREQAQAPVWAWAPE